MRIAYPFGIGYGDDIDETTRILLAVADEMAEIPDDPEPSVRIADLGDNAVVLQARFWMADPDREDFSAVRSTYIQRATGRCEDAGIDLSTTTNHNLSGEVTVESGNTPAVGQS